jgi:hypothetical protein
MTNKKGRLGFEGSLQDEGKQPELSKRKHKRMEGERERDGCVDTFKYFTKGTFQY